MPGADFLQLDASRAPARGVTAWLAGELRSAIVDGRLVDGDRLPPTRVLAAELGIARGAVVEAYARLGEEGFARARTRAGTTISARTGPPTPVAPTQATVGEHGLRVMPGAPPPGIRWDLNPGLPDLTDFPRAAWLRHERAALSGTPAAELGYGDPRGHIRLREALAGWLIRTRGLDTDPDRILVVSGVAQSLALLAQLLHGAGKNTVAVEDPGSAGAVEAMQHWGVRCVPVPVDNDGIVVPNLADTAADSVLLTPAHQFPTGVVLAPYRRAQLLRWATDGGRLIIEDDYDADQRYDRTPVAAVQPLAPELVAHTGSTSKSLAPGMRLGWLIPPRELYDGLVEARRASDLCAPALPQLVLAGLIASGDYDRHLRRQRRRQRERRDALLAALRQALPNAEVGGIAAGLHLQLTLPWLPDSYDDEQLADALARQGVRVQPLRWHRHAPGAPGLVVGYGAESPAALAEAARLIGDEVAQVTGAWRAPSAR